jgi:hypothetical protein
MMALDHTAVDDRVKSRDEVPEVSTEKVAKELSAADLPAQDNRDYLTRRFDEGLRNWLKDTSKGIVTSTVTVLFMLLLVQIGLVSEGQDLSFSLFAPYEFWKSFSGLVIEWSQWNEWLLLAMGLVLTAVTAVVYVRWRNHRGQDPEPTLTPGTKGGKRKREPLTKRAEATMRSMKSVGTFGMFAAIFFGAYLYQQYLWNIELPVPDGRIGIAFTRQIGSSVARDTLADNLRQMGHENQIVMRDLPVKFDARDVEKARSFAQRIHADAVVIYREENAPPPAGAQRVPGLASPPEQAAGDGKQHVAYLVFADPSLGIEIPVTRRVTQGAPEMVQMRTKDGVDVPRLETSDLSNLMEAAAGILMYDRDRYMAAVAHLSNASSGMQKVRSGEGQATDALVQFYLGNAYYLIEQDDRAAEAFDRAIQAGERIEAPGLQDRLLLAQTYIYRATLYFDSHDFDQSERLLKKAIALREPLDKDESALADPANFRRLHETAGTAYLRLLDLALYTGDEDARALWAGRVRTEADLLAARTDDVRAQAGAVRMLYRTGACTDAYSLAYSILERKPDYTAAHRLVQGVAALRDGNWVGIESKLQLDALLSANPSSLTDLHNLLIYHSISSFSNDTGYLEQVRADTDAILALDPSNVEALQRYVDAVEGYAGMDLLFDPSLGLFSVGDARTFRKLQTTLLSDPRQIQRVFAMKEAARPYLTRWAEEVEPESTRPLLYSARFSAQWARYVSLYLGAGGSSDTTIMQLNVDAWNRAVKDANRVLDSGRNPSARERAEAHAILSDLYRGRYLENLLMQNNEAAGEDLNQALSHAEEATRLVDSDPSGRIEDLFLDYTAYNNYALATYFATFYHSDSSPSADKALADKYTKLNETLSKRATELQEKAYKPYFDDNTYMNRLVCPGDNLRVNGEQALQQGNIDGALGMFEEYRKRYPHDPAALWSLGWAQYLKGDFAAALASTQEFEKQVSWIPAASSNRVIIYLAQGDNASAARAFADFEARLEKLPLGERLRYLAAFGQDLYDLAHKPEARVDVATILPAVEKYIAGLPPEARTDRGSQLILGLSNLGGAALWAGDNAAAESLLNSALQLNDDYVPVRSNLALLRLVSGDAKGAEEEYGLAIKSAGTYLHDIRGNDLTATERVAASQDARHDLEQAAATLREMMKQHPDMQAAGGPLASRLESSAAAYGNQASNIKR